MAENISVLMRNLLSRGSLWFACLVSANAGALAQSICKFSTKHLNSNVNFAMAGFGISVIIYIFLWSIRYLKSDIKNQRN